MSKAQAQRPVRPSLRGLSAPGHQHSAGGWFIRRELPMEPSYSVLADALSKFHASSDLIKALCLISLPAMALGICYCLMQILKEIVLAFRRRDETMPGEPLYAIYRTDDGRWMLHARGEMRELEPEELSRFGMELAIRHS